MKQPMETMVEQLYLFRLKYFMEHHLKDDTGTTAAE